MGDHEGIKVAGRNGVGETIPYEPRVSSSLSILSLALIYTALLRLM